ncbi:MAG: LLM class flavin-dependent oxidoreductase [Flavisolibacter sp.]
MFAEEMKYQKSLSDLAVSILDLATILEGQSPADAYIRCLTLARSAEDLEYKRYWFAEHHNMESVASSATAVLVGYIAANTKKIRVGSGGVMLPNHAPLIIAEQFGTLASIYPGRIDLGIGRAPGTDPITTYALRKNKISQVDDFPTDLQELLSYLGPKNPEAKVRAIPGEGTEIPVWLLGSSTYSAQLAAVSGLPFAFASHFAPTYLLEAFAIYKKLFRSSKYLKEPYCIACVNVIAADTVEHAEFLATSFYQLALGMIRNKRRPLPPPVAPGNLSWTEAERAAIGQMTHYSFIGDVQEIKKGLQSLVKATQFNELMITSHIYDLQAKLHCHGIIRTLFK